MGRKRNGKNRSASRARSCREQAGTVLTNGSIEFWKRATKSHDAPRGCEMLGGRTPAFQPAPMPRNRPQLGVPFQVATGVPFLVAISKTDQPFREGSAVEADGISPRANGVELRRQNILKILCKRGRIVLLLPVLPSVIPCPPSAGRRGGRVSGRTGSDRHSPTAKPNVSSRRRKHFRLEREF